MKTYISILRGINVGGRKMITMDALSKLYESLGCTHVITYIQSGNVIFDSSRGNSQDLGEAIARKIKESCRIDVDVFMRSRDDFDRIIKNNPFSNNKNTSRLYVTFLSDIPSDHFVNTLDAGKGGAEEFVIAGKEIYVFCPNGYGRAKFSNNYFEKKLNVSATTRNWNTVTTLFSMATGQEG
jgi:uncharacterized protein (DUF1697 family)